MIIEHPAYVYNIAPATDGNFIRVMYDKGLSFVTCRTNDTTKNAYISCLSVNEPHRNKGIGTLTMEVIESAAKDEGMKTATLEILPDSGEKIIDWFIKRGYSDTGKDNIYKKTL